MPRTLNLFAAALVTVSTFGLAAPALASPQGEPVKLKATASYVGVVHSGDGRVNLRSAPSLTGRILRTVPSGTKLGLECRTTGDKVKGTLRTTAQWDRLRGGGFISHAYVLAPKLPACLLTPAGPPTRPTVPTTPTVPPPLGDLTAAQFITAVAPAARAGWYNDRVPASVTIAQAILESGWGKSALARTDANYFGIKCFAGQAAPLASGCHTYNTFECSKEGVCSPTTASFRTYASVTNSFRDHSTFLRTNKRYAPAFFTTTSDQFIAAVWKAGYATDPNYVTKVTNLMVSYNLYAYDAS